MSLILSGTDGLSDVDGSAATPAVRGTDANTGIFFPAADTIAFSEGGVESMRIDSAGNVGIGTASPTFVNGGGLQITKATAANLRLTDSANASYNFDFVSNSGDGYLLNRSTSGSILLYTNGSERMRISSAGYITYANNPAFNASLNGSNQNVTSGSTVTLTFGTASYNRGSAYNASTYIFTAPVAGMYQFNARARVDGITGGLNYAILALITSGKTYNDICSASGSYNNLTIAVATYMSLGDTAYVTLNSSGQTINSVNTQPVYSDFSGFLIG
jgi:hypothetical protein